MNSLLLPMWAASLANERRIEHYHDAPLIAWFVRVMQDDCMATRTLLSGRKLFLIYESFEYIILGIGLLPPLQDSGAFYDTWIYDDVRRALYALEMWNPETQPEPPGWYRHPATARRRPGGDVSQEYLWE